jgi:hypothetical protein
MIIISEFSFIFHPPLNPLPSREGQIKKSPLPLWERVRVRGKNSNNF